MEQFFLVRGFLQEAFVLNNLPFMKWEINYQMVQTNSQMKVLMELLRKKKGSQHVESYFHSYFGT